MADQNLNAERLREILDYDPETGIFRWKVKKKRSEVGSVAGGIHKPSGYIQIVWACRRYTGHRLAWLHVHGGWPSGQIDHINGDRADNRMANLREATPRVNAENKRRPGRNKVHGVLLGSSRSVSKSKPWMARIKVGDKQRYLGVFETEEKAHEAYVAAKRKYHEGCTL